MSLNQEASSCQGDSSRKTERNRRIWSQKEESILISSLKDLISNGWKSDNGFRAGYLIKLEDALRKDSPATDIKAMPHINSKLSSWKKSYYSLTQMLSRSGVGFNSHGNHMIDCEDDQWDQIVKIDANARLMRYKVWPYYDDWKEIFGKDRANGENVDDVVEIVNDLLKGKEPQHDGMPHMDTNFSFVDDTNDTEADKISENDRDEQSSKKTPKTRKMKGELQGVCELLSEMTHSTNSRLEQLANRIGYDFDMGKARQEVFEQLEAIPGLSLDDRFVVCELVAFKAERLDIWKGMKSESRVSYVAHLLKANGVK